MMVIKAREYPVSTAEIGVRPDRTSSRMRSNTSTLASTAMPMVKTMPAMPGNVSVACRKLSTPRINTMLTTSATSAMKPNWP